MPPKKNTLKEIAAEAKKQNKLKAQKVLDDMRKEAEKSESGGGRVVKKSTRSKSEKDRPSKSIPTKDTLANLKRSPVISNVGDYVSTKKSEERMPTSAGGGGCSVEPFEKIVTVACIERPPKSSASDDTESMEISKSTSKDSTTRKSTGKKAARSGASVDLFDKIVTVACIERPPKSSASDGTESMEISKPTSKDSTTRKSTGKKDARSGASVDLFDKIETLAYIETPPKSSTSDGTESMEISKPTSKDSKTPKPRRYTGKKATRGAGSSHGCGYQYEIDCKNVADSINVKDLKMHVEKHLKINGKKDNLGTAVSVVCDGQKVVIKSEGFFPKKALRFLSKKFLKKNWNIRVESKNAHSYEFKYVGTV